MNYRKNFAPLLVASIMTLGAAPLAFAQDAAQDGKAAEMPPQSTSATPPTEGAAGQQSETTTQAPPAEAGDKTNWNDLDSDGNGSLSKTEVASVPSLSQVFDAADADKDGQLTQDEYKAWLAANYGDKGQPGKGG
ncbi:EF-hand domain-containing protein [Lysobacter pythonis]|uniref:EF-hand domain-containing protein n=1 Tax=Solilutibacter pythonis TaxID=2483112 RepID=A0A3M2I567_9GAMM|nr:EF-hand domain-containing protein [Lysobacter pythonis]RMH93404.1 EF-hand domain-containing protein [Lysobacter pythonis]